MPILLKLLGTLGVLVGNHRKRLNEKRIRIHLQLGHNPHLKNAINIGETFVLFLQNILKNFMYKTLEIMLLFMVKRKKKRYVTKIYVSCILSIVSSLKL